MSDLGGGRRPVACCDLDGVVWRGDIPIPGAAEGVKVMRAAGLRVVFLTNNSSGRVGDNLARLAAAGIEAESDDLVTSAQSAAALVARGAGGAAEPVLACAGAGVVEALEEHGLETVDAGADVAVRRFAAVVVGWHRSFDFDRMRRAADAVRAGARFVATNLDPTYPGAEGLLPGAGAIVAAVAAAGGRAPEVAGKPEAPMAHLVGARCGDPVVMIGDRPSTDGAFAKVLGVPFALVLSGIAGATGGESVPDPAPAFVAPDLGAVAPQLAAAFGAEGVR